MRYNEGQLQYLAAKSKGHSHKNGFLFKKGGKKNASPDHTSVRWQKRWCTIYYNMFFYFESQLSAKPQGVIFLEGATMTSLATQEKSYFCFAIGMPGEEQRQYLFGCEFKEDYDSWMHSIMICSGDYVLKCNNEIVQRIGKLEDQVHCLKELRDKHQQECSDHLLEISRLKLELSSFRRDNYDKNIPFFSMISPAKSLDVEPHLPISHGYTDEDIAKIRKLQNFVRTWLTQKRWRGLVKSYLHMFTAEKLQERNKLLWQFISNEEDYFKQIVTLVNVFLKPMKVMSHSLDPDLSKEEHSAIFSTCDSILVLHQLLMSRAARIAKEWPVIHIDELLVAVLTSIPVYVEYIRAHPTSLQTLAECKKRERFLKMLNWFESKPECHGQTLEQFLIYPIRVVPNYIRNVHAILKVTPLNHVERTSLESLLAKLEEVQVYNHFIDEGESIRHTLEVERLIEGGCHTLLNSNQKFIRHGVLKQLEHYNGVNREKIRHCFLFTQHLIVTSRTCDGKLRLSKIMGMVPLTMSNLVENVDNTSFSEAHRSLAFTLHFTHEARMTEAISLTLMASKANEKALWTSDITQCIYNLALEVSSDSSVFEEEQSKDDICDSAAPLPAKQVHHHVSIRDDPRLRESSTDILYSEELAGPCQLPQILYASVDRLIERLSDPRLPGAEFMETFLLTYKTFTNSLDVMKGLIEAYWRVMENQSEHDVQFRGRIDSSQTRDRCESVLSISSFSDDGLDTSFSNVLGSPLTSTTVFNYATLKQQLTSPSSGFMLDKRENRSSSMVKQESTPVVKPTRPQSMEATSLWSTAEIATITEKRRASIVQPENIETIDEMLRKQSNGVTTGSTVDDSKGTLIEECEMDNHVETTAQHNALNTLLVKEECNCLSKGNIVDQTELVNGLDDVLSHLSSSKSSTSSCLVHSNSDEVISKTQIDHALPKSSHSLERAPRNVASAAINSKKGKQTKVSKLRASSEPQSPKFLSIKRGDAHIQRSLSAYEPAEEVSSYQSIISQLKNDKKKLNKTKSNISLKQSPDNSVKRKRSLFTVAKALSPFRKSIIKRSSSEQFLNANTSVTHVSPLANSQLLSTSMGKINENEQLPAAAKSESTLSGFKKRMKASMRAVQPHNEKKVARNRKMSVFDQKIITVNRGPLKIMSILKHWLAKHPKDFLEDLDLATLMEEFFMEIKSDKRTLPVVFEILSSLEKSIVAHRKSMSSVHPFDLLLLKTLGAQCDESKGHHAEPLLLHIHPVNVVAENMTLLEHHLYSKISFNEFISCQWTKRDKDTKAPGIMKFIRRFNQVTGMIGYEIVHGASPLYRASMIEFWIQVAAHCRDMNNFNAVMEIISALNATPVHRLKKSWELVSKSMRHIFIGLERLVSADRSFKYLREAVHICNPPCVPYLGIYLSDLLFVQEGGRTFDDKLRVNFSKMCRVSRLVREVKSYQQLPYTFTMDETVASSLVNFVITVNEDMLYEKSLLAEPRES